MMNMKVTGMIDAQLMNTGTRIYYTGDVANNHGWGEVVALRQPTRFQDMSVDLMMDDGRSIKGLIFPMFHPGCGQRFYLASEWEIKQKIAEEEMRRQYAAMMEKRSTK